MKKKILVPILLATLLNQGCKKTEVGTGTLTQKNESSSGDPIVKNGILHFTSKNAFNAYLQKMWSLEYKDRVAYEVRLGYKSVETSLQEINAAEVEWSNKIASMNNPSLINDKTISPHTSKYTEALNNKFIVENRDNEGATSFTLNLSMPSLWTIITDKNMYVIGETLYYVTPTGFNYGANCDPSALASARQSTKNIHVFDIKNMKEVLSSNGNTILSTTNWNPCTSNTISGRRLTFAVYYNAIVANGGLSSWIRHEWEMKIEKKNFWGDWVYDDNTVPAWIDLKWTLNEDANFFSPSISHEFHKSGNSNHWAESTNPYYDNNSAFGGVGTLFMKDITLSGSSMRFITPTVLYSGSYQASCWGGPSGIYVIHTP